MKALERNKGIVVAVLVFAMAILIYNYFFKPSVVAVESGAEAQNIGNDVVELSEGLGKVKFDQSLFAQPAYRSLVDWSPALQNQPVGRSNPFAPIGQ